MDDRPLNINFKRHILKGKARIIVLFLIDFCIAAFTYWLFIYRYRLTNAAVATNTLIVFFATILVSVVLMRLLFQIYLQMWRYASSSVYLRMVLADLCGGLLYLLIDRTFFAWHLPLYVAVSSISVGLLAILSARYIYQYLRRHQGGLLLSRSSVSVERSNRINVAIVGAGETGVFLTQELLMHRNSRYHPIFLIDNDPRKIGTSVEGVRVIGPDHRVLPEISKLPIQEIIIALPKLKTQEREEVFQQYMKTGCKVMIYDYPVDRMNQNPKKPQIRDINIEDLLFREPISLKDKDTMAYYNGKRVLVTGAGGSIGSELSRQLAAMDPKQLILLDVYENSIYELQQELKRRHGNALELHTVITSVCDANRMDEVFERFKPQVVFHAAAHKHVPLMEENCGEAVHNNVFGTYTTVQAAEKHGASRFVLISTDKAVNPTNMMGATKRLCEIIVQSRRASQTHFAAVRFGNVLGSNGSVVPLFRKQIEEGGPVTITDKRIIRYFMTIPEAAQLVLRSGRRAERSEVYVLDMGKPIKILDLAKKLISLSGFEPEKDIKISEIGLRPGEKLYEELLVNRDQCQRTEDDRIFIEQVEAPDQEEVNRVLRALRQALDMRADDELIKHLMMRILPTYRTAQEVNETAYRAEEVLEADQESGTAVQPPLGIPL